MESSTTFQAYTTLMWLIVFGLFSEIKATCELTVDSPHASAIHAPGPHPYPRYSCTQCKYAAPDKVYILNIYQPTGSNRRFKQKPHDVKTVKVNILANSTVRLELLLRSYEAANWLIDKPEAVTISRVILMSQYNDYSSVKLTDKGYLNVQKRRTHFFKNVNKAIFDYAQIYMGRVTSYSAVYETLQWWLTVGDCSTSPVDVNPSISPLNSTTPDLRYCETWLWSKPCWTEYDFVYESHKNECKGKQYVTEFRLDYSGENYIYYIGAILCTATRYSLFMATSLQDTFLGIVDTQGEGEDHCQLVGLEWPTRVNTDPVSVQYSSQRLVYYRKHWGDVFYKRTIMSGKEPQWYECGVTIPDSEVIPITGPIITTTTTTTETPPSPVISQGFSWLTCVGIIVTLLIAAAVIIAVVRCCSSMSASVPDVHERQPAPPSSSRPAPLAPLAPSAPPAAPPTQDTGLLPPAPPYMEAPPPYEEVMSYPVAKTKIAAPPCN